MSNILNLKTVLALSAIAGALLLAPAFAASEPAVGDVLGTVEADIRTALEARGYTVEEIEFEDDEIEVEIAMNDVELELEIDPETGAIVEIETDD